MNIPTIKDKDEAKSLIVLATLAGSIMLKNGAEIYRVEDSVIRLCKCRGNIRYVEAYVIPTGIFISMEYGGELLTYIKRIKSMAINLDKIVMVNEFSRQFVNSNMSIHDGIEELKKIKNSKSASMLKKSTYGSMASACFCILLGGSILEGIGSSIASFIVLNAIHFISRLSLTSFVNNIFGGMLASFLSIIYVSIGFGQNVDKVIIGSIMCLVPGYAITNAIRDTMSGDLVSGLSRGMEAIFSAISIALGVGIILNFYAKGIF